MSLSNTHPIKIVLIDKYALVRAGLRMLIESYPTLRIVGDTDSCTNALPLVVQHKPDIILLTTSTDRSKDVDDIPQLLDAAKNARLLLLTNERNVDLNHHAAQLGAMGLIFSDQSPEILVKAIGKVHAGEAWFDRATIANVLTKMSRNRESVDPEAEKIATLSPRERQVIELMGEGLKNQQIAERLGLSEITVRHHLTSIFSKLDVADRLELIIYAYQHNLAQLPG